MRNWVDLDRQSVEVWPCLHEEQFGDWILRFGGGLYGRSNSVQPFGLPDGDLEPAIEHCEAAYRRENLPPMFRIPDFEEFVELDERLTERGYEITANSGKVMVVEPLEGTLHLGVSLSQNPSPEWIELYVAGSGRDDVPAETVRALYERVPTPRCFAEIRGENEVFAIGMGTVWKGTLWFFGITTDPNRRRQGHARAICESILAWGRENGSVRAALQVTPTNEGAIALYESLGFRHAYQYHYRRLPA